MARTAQISKEKWQSIITLRHEGQSMRNISRTLKVSSSAVAKPSSTMMKLALMRTVTGVEDPELLLQQRISSLELPASEISAQINASQSSSNRHISTSTVQRRLRESGLHGWIAAKNPLLSLWDAELVNRWSPHVWFPLWSTDEEVWWCGGACDTICDLFRIQGILNQYGYHSILQQYAIQSGLRLVGL